MFKRLGLFIKRLLKYLMSFPNVFSENSTKLLSLLIAAFSGGLIATVIIPFILIWDVVHNNSIVTSLTDMGIFLLCVGGFIFGAGATVKIPDLPFPSKSKDKKETKQDNNQSIVIPGDDEA